MRQLSIILIFAALALGPLGASADDNDSRPIVVAQNNCKSLSEAVQQLRSQTGGRILSAETKESGAPLVHHIKVLTKDGKVKTHKVQGRKRGG